MLAEQGTHDVGENMKYQIPNLHSTVRFGILIAGLKIMLLVMQKSVIDQRNTCCLVILAPQSRLFVTIATPSLSCWVPQRSFDSQI